MRKTSATEEHLRTPTSIVATSSGLAPVGGTRYTREGPPRPAHRATIDDLLIPVAPGRRAVLRSTSEARAYGAAFKVPVENDGRPILAPDHGDSEKSWMSPAWAVKDPDAPVRASTLHALIGHVLGYKVDSDSGGTPTPCLRPASPSRRQPDGRHLLVQGAAGRLSEAYGCI